MKTGSTGRRRGKDRRFAFFLWKRSHPGKIPACRRCARSAETRLIAASRGFSFATGKSCSPRRSQTARISRRYTCAAQSRQGICRRFQCIRSPRMCSTMPLRWSTAPARFSPFAQSRFRRASGPSGSSFWKTCRTPATSVQCFAPRRRSARSSWCSSAIAPIPITRKPSVLPWGRFSASGSGRPIFPRSARSSANGSFRSAARRSGQRALM